jgi:8-oxo-dGTP pyrophosphatase MutT (NUDIX family)
VQVPADLLADVERTSVRVVLRDLAGHLLLFDTVDPLNPALGSWWELPGGGMEPGESISGTAARELAEETGLVLPTGSFEPSTWTRTATYLRRGRRVLQHEHVVAATIALTAPAPSREHRTAEELEDYVGHRWWSVEEVRNSKARFFPGRLPDLLAAFLAGERIVEPFEWWN